MTSAFETLTPHERAVVVDRLGPLLDDRLLNVRWEHECRWHDAGLTPLVSDWLREVLDRAIRDMRRDLLALLRDLPPEP